MTGALNLRKSDAANTWYLSSFASRWPHLHRHFARHRKTALERPSPETYNVSIAYHMRRSRVERKCSAGDKQREEELFIVHRPLWMWETGEGGGILVVTMPMWWAESSTGSHFPMKAQLNTNHLGTLGSSD